MSCEVPVAAGPSTRRSDHLRGLRRREYCKDLASWQSQAADGTTETARQLCESVFDQIEQDATRRDKLDDFLQVPISPR